MERTHIRERQASGTAAAKAIGKRWGGRKSGTGIKADLDRVLELRGRDLTNREIGQALNISERTVIHANKHGNEADNSLIAGSNHVTSDSQSW